MRKLSTSDIKDLREYERERDEFRAEIIATKNRRRLNLGDLISIVFENTDTMRFQIQEMARAEKMLRDEQIAHEINTYNQLLPETGELSGTMFIEIDDQAALREWLPRLFGVEHHVSFAVAGDRVSAREEDAERLTREDVTSAVHYLKFAFTPDQQRAFAAGPVGIAIDHPEYRADITLSDEQRVELASDFTA
ncbi:MAG: DUF3501 family protein [Acidimicrobiia bacterium]